MLLKSSLLASLMVGSAAAASSIQPIVMKVRYFARLPPSSIPSR